jgi:hypothetical protein
MTKKWGGKKYSLVTPVKVECSEGRVEDAHLESVAGKPSYTYASPPL